MKKAYDFTNRYELVKMIMKKGIGKRFVNAIVNIYNKTRYIPKLEKQQLGEPISPRDGVPQGRKTSANLFSVYISDMGESIKVEKSFLRPVCMYVY